MTKQLTNAERFERAFPQPRPTDDQIARLDGLMRAVERLNIYTGAVDYRTPDGVKCVGPQGCEMCGQSDCGHQAYTRVLVDQARDEQEQDAADLAATYEGALGVGVQ